MAKLPLTTRRPERFEPPGYDDAPERPAILLKIPTLADRHDFTAALIEAGLRMPADDELEDELVAMLEQLDDTPLRAQWLATIEALRDWREKNAAARDDSERPAPLSEAVVDSLAGLQEVAKRNWPPYNRLIAQRVRWNLRAPYILVGMFATGWEGYPVAFGRSFDGRVAEESLEQIPREDIDAAAARILGLMTPSQADRGNSAGPSLSPSAPAISTAPKSRRTGGRDGKSPAASTDATRALN